MTTDPAPDRRTLIAAINANDLKAFDTYLTVTDCDYGMNFLIELDLQPVTGSKDHTVRKVAKPSRRVPLTPELTGDLRRFFWSECRTPSPDGKTSIDLIKEWLA
jgi:hypothetical protein